MIIKNRIEIKELLEHKDIIVKAFVKRLYHEVLKI